MARKIARKPSQRIQDAHRRRVDDAFAYWQGQSHRITTWAIENGHGNVPWRDLEPMVPAALLVIEKRARQMYNQAQHAAVAAYCAYWDNGTFRWIRW